MICEKSNTVNPISYLAIWLIVISVNLSSAEQFKVYSSSTSTMVDVGEDAIINCYLEPEISAVDMEIRWIKANDGSTIHKYRKGVEEIQGVNRTFHGRTELIKYGIEKGNVSLKILNIQPSDKGLYICYFQSKFMYDEAKIEIQPRAIGKSPFLSIEIQGFDLKVTCSSSGWYPQPDGQWLSDDKKKMAEISKSIDKTGDGLYSISISIIFTKESKKKYCVIQNTYLEHPRAASIYLSDSLFTDIGKTITNILLGLLLGVLIFLVFFCISVLLYEYKGMERKEVKEEFIQAVEHAEIKQAVELAEIKQAVELAEIKQAVELAVFIQAVEHAVDVRLDPETAHPDLTVSDDLKCLSRATERQSVPDNEKRFDTRLYVLGKEGLSKARNYWMVNVEGSRHWTIGVAYETIPRKGKLNLSPEEGFWVIELNGGNYVAYEDRSMKIKRPKEPRHIGIYISLKTGKVVFYDADKGQIIYSFKTKFQSTIQLYPFFSVWKAQENIHVCSDGCPHCPREDSDEYTQMLHDREAEDSKDLSSV